MKKNLENNLYSSDNTLNNISIFDYNEFFLAYNNIIHKISLIRKENEILINSDNYMIGFNKKEFNLISRIKFESINQIYEFMIDSFYNGEVIIKNFQNKKEINLIFKNNANITLSYNKENRNYIIEELNNLKKEINSLKFNNNSKSTNDPKKLELAGNITEIAYAYTDLVKSFTAFKSIDEILYLIYATKNKSIICFDLENQRIIKEIREKHNEYITNLVHYLDNISKTDFVMSISLPDNNLNIWEVKNWNHILNISDAYESGFIYSGCFLCENENNFIVLSNYNNNKFDESQPIKIFDFNGQKVKEINNSNENSFFIDNYYDKYLNKNYIITGNNDSVISYDVDSGEIYHRYKDNGIRIHPEVIIKSNEEIIKLIESSDDGSVRIWNFHSGLLLKNISLRGNVFKGMCLWNDNYLFVGCEDQTIKLIELNNGIVVKDYKGHNNEVVTIKKILHPQYGECLLSQGWEEDQIRIWILNNDPNNNN